MSLWVITKQYDIANCKTNIVSVVPYEEFIAKNGAGTVFAYNGQGTDMIEAIDALDAWKRTREIYSERD